MTVAMVAAFQAKPGTDVDNARRKKIVIIIAILVILAIMAMVAFSLFLSVGTAAVLCAAGGSVPFIDFCESMDPDEGTACNASVSSQISTNIPSDWRALIDRVAVEKNVNPNFLAALYLTENGNKWRPFDYDWPSSSAGASGPMQFMPGTWASVHDPEHPDINDPDDAMRAAANLIKRPEYGGTTPTTALGDLERPWQRATLLYSAGAYNWGPGNAEDTSEDSPIGTGPTETENYQRNIHELLMSDLTRSGHPNYDDPEDETGGTGGRQGSDGGRQGTPRVIPASDTAARQTPTTLSWPVDGGTPDGAGFQPPDHNGVDFEGELGAPIYAVADGEVTVARRWDPLGDGTLITIEHEINGQRVTTSYAHMPDPREYVEEGDEVQAGERIGSIGEAGHAVEEGPHLHFEVRADNELVDPLAWLQSNGASNNATVDDCGGSGSVAGITPPIRDENGNWPREYCTIIPDPTTSTGCITARTKIYVDMITAYGLPPSTVIMCFGYRGNTTWHDDGKACDIHFQPLGECPAPERVEAGRRIADFLAANAETWAISEIMWQDKIWTHERRDDGWRDHHGTTQCTPGSSGATFPHYDNLHVTVF